MPYPRCIGIGRRISFAHLACLYSSADHFLSCNCKAGCTIRWQRGLEPRASRLQWVYAVAIPGRVVPVQLPGESPRRRNRPPPAGPRASRTSSCLGTTPSQCLTVGCCLLAVPLPGAEFAKSPVRVRLRGYLSRLAFSKVASCSILDVIFLAGLASKAVSRLGSQEWLFPGS